MAALQIPDGYSLQGGLPIPDGYALAPRMHDEPFTDPMTGQVLGTQTGPDMPGNKAFTDAARFGITAGARAAGAIGNFIADPLAGPRSLISPELNHALDREVGPLAAPGTAAADAFFKGTGIPESKPESAIGRVGLSGLTGGLAGGPLGLGAAGIGALGGVAGQGTMEATGSERAATAAGLAAMALGGLGGKTAGEYFKPAPDRAGSILARRIQSDAAGGGPDLNALREALANLQDQGKPVAIADVAGPATRGLGEAIANRPGSGATVAEKFLNERDAGAGPRLLGDLGNAMGAGPSAFETAQTLAEQRQAASAPLYERALNTDKTIHSDRLQQFLDDPITQQGLVQGIEVQRLEALAEGKPFNPNDYTIVYDDSGTPRFSPTPNMRTLDAAKRGLDNILDQYRDSASGRLVLDQRGRAIDQVRKAYLGELDSLNGDYAAARQAWSGPSQSMGAMKQGADIFNLQPEQIAENIQRLAPGDKDFFLLGARDALAQRIAKTSAGGNEALRIVGNQHTQNQLRPLFDSDAEFNSFIGRAQLESLMYRTKSDTLGNSRTFRRLANDAADQGGQGSAMDTALAGIGLMTSQPLAALPMGLKMFRGARDWLTRPSPQVDANVARMLFSGDPAQNAATLEALTNARRPASMPFFAPAMLPPPIMGERGR